MELLQAKVRVCSCYDGARVRVFLSVALRSVFDLMHWALQTKEQDKTSLCPLQHHTQKHTGTKSQKE